MLTSDNFCSQAMFTPLPKMPLGRFALFILHSLAVYFIALRMAPWIIGRWFAWILPATGTATAVSSADWYLQHLIVVTALPALIVGGLADRHRFSAVFAWIVPTVVLAYKMLRFTPAHSVLGSSSASVFSYFFGELHGMPTFTDLTAGDPVRIFTQMFVTAPFIAGVAYSLGAICATQLFDRVAGPTVADPEETQQKAAASEL